MVKRYILLSSLHETKRAELLWDYFIQFFLQDDCLTGCNIWRFRPDFNESYTHVCQSLLQRTRQTAMVSKKRGRPIKNATPSAPPPRQSKQPSRQSSRTAVRRSSRLEVELLMECMDDELSPAQLKAMETAQSEHEKVFDIY